MSSEQDSFAPRRRWKATSSYGEPPMTATMTALNSPTPHPTPLPPTVLFILCGILFYVFVNNVFGYDLCKILNENVLKCEFKIVNCDFELCVYGDLFNGYYYPPPTPSPAPLPTEFDIINSRIRLREQLVLKDEFDIVYGGEYDLNNVCDCDVNENFYCNGYDCGVLLSRPYPTPTSPGAPIVDFINSRAGLRKQLVLKDLFDIIYGDFGIENSVINEICNGHGAIGGRVAGQTGAAEAAEPPVEQSGALSPALNIIVGKEEEIIFNTGATTPNTTNFNYNNFEGEVERKRIINICVYGLFMVGLFGYILVPPGGGYLTLVCGLFAPIAAFISTIIGLIGRLIGGLFGGFNWNVFYIFAQIFYVFYILHHLYVKCLKYSTLSILYRCCCVYST